LSTQRHEILSLDILTEEYANYLHDICTFIEESATKRVEAIKLGEIQLVEQAISAEIALAAGVGRTDIILFLAERLKKLIDVNRKIKICETNEYRETFSLMD
jgi:hypothetical protein